MSAAPPDPSQWHTVTVRVPFQSPEHANVALNVIGVDNELQPRVVKRTLAVEGNELVATFSTLTVRLARLALNAFLDNLDLVVRTLGEFGDEAEKPPSSSTSTSSALQRSRS